jgi:hypothetical protein
MEHDDSAAMDGHTVVTPRQGQCDGMARSKPPSQHGRVGQGHDSSSTGQTPEQLIVCLNGQLVIISNKSGGIIHQGIKALRARLSDIRA